MLPLLYGPALTTVHDQWEDHSLDDMNLCQQSNVSAFEYAIYVGHNFSSKEYRMSYILDVSVCSLCGLI